MKNYKFKSTVYFRKTKEKSIVLDFESDEFFHFSGDAALMVAMIALASDQKKSVTVDSLQENLIKASEGFSKNGAQRASIEEALTFMIKNNLVEVI
jgi:uncharacterized LabA/DUF88 family protein